jgi:cupin fold WbuC family metalloprotein
MRIKQYNNEVLYADNGIVKVCRQDIDRLKEMSNDNERKRIRLCTHNDVDDEVHEMLIVHSKDTYVRPHKHLNKIESFHIIEGLVDVVLFDEEGHLTEVINMGGYDSGRAFYYRICEPLYHSLLIKSEVLVFHEVTSGPFKRTDTIFPVWAPEEKDFSGQKRFMKKMTVQVDNLLFKSEKDI